MEVSGKRADDVSELCDVCKSNSANGFCNDCKEYLCQGCFQDHKKGKPCRHHVLAPFEQAVILMSQKIYEEKCKVHTTENIRYYCRKHDVVGCGDCIVYQHGGCRAEIIKDLAMKFEESTDFKELLRRIEKFDAEKNVNVTKLEDNNKHNKILVDKALDEIRKFRKEINDYLDQAEQTFIIQANKHSKDNEIIFSQVQQKIDEVAKEIDELREQLDTRVHQGEDLFIRAVECKGREIDVQRSIAEIKSRNVIKTYSFQPEQTIKDMIMSNAGLGTIQLLPLKIYSPPDPRSAGLDVGKRVKLAKGYVEPDNKSIGTKQGTIVSVDPTGWVEVSWDQGDTFRVIAGNREMRSVKLL